MVHAGPAHLIASPGPVARALAHLLRSGQTDHGAHTA